MTTHHPDVARIKARLAAGETSREALVTQALEDAASAPAAHVFTRLYADAALAAAGETKLAGSLACQGKPAATADAPAVARLRAAGAAIVGKTNMTEFASVHGDDARPAAVALTLETALG